MPCYHPIRGFRSRLPNSNGKFAVCFSGDGYADANSPVLVPCGQCIGCKLDRSRHWAIRCVHEASLYDKNCFITVTYDDKFVPEGHTLVKSHFQDFLKRLRFKFSESKIRYFMCGEYGERFGRPHYHACLFNFDFPDKVLWRAPQKKNGNVLLYRSKILEELWPFGFCTIGAVTFESAAYVARYIVKKITGDAAKEHYTYIDPGTGEFYERLPEYTTMSRGGRGKGLGGIGKPWLNKYMSDVFPDDFVVLRGAKMAPPRYYRAQFELEQPVKSYILRQKRKLGSSTDKALDEMLPARLKVRESISLSRVKLLKRSVDDDI